MSARSTSCCSMFRLRGSAKEPDANPRELIQLSFNPVTLVEEQPNGIARLFQRSATATCCRTRSRSASRSQRSSAICPTTRRAVKPAVYTRARSESTANRYNPRCSVCSAVPLARVVPRAARERRTQRAGTQACPPADMFVCSCLFPVR